MNHAIPPDPPGAQPIYDRPEGPMRRWSRRRHSWWRALLAVIGLAGCADARCTAHVFVKSDGLFDTLAYCHPLAKLELVGTGMVCRCPKETK